MTIDLGKLHVAADTYYSSQPHPLVPQLTMGDYPAYEHAASLLHGASKPTAEQVANTHEQLKGAGVSPADFEYAWNVAKPLAGRLLGREPSMTEIARLAPMQPGEIHGFYFDHPHPEHPDVTAGEMARYHRVAEPIARRYGTGRPPTPGAVARMASGKWSSDDIHRWYTDGW